jgi:hypothetical protein
MDERRQGYCAGQGAVRRKRNARDVRAASGAAHELQQQDDEEHGEDDFGRAIAANMPPLTASNLVSSVLLNFHKLGARNTLIGQTPATTFSRLLRGGGGPFPADFRRMRKKPIAIDIA